ncbi:MAG TPA: VOC family protein [Planctomycetaceae bacterium]|jgi:catechol 2,3-dioxygenase-like lactoylglutathione lyase family enzyme|nr:VOC family protein [Planctomycetaceae bacterium]
MIIGIDHVQITVPSGQETAARAFYCGVLGLPEIEKPAALKPRGGFWLKVGDRELHVGTEDGVNRRATKAHVAFAVEDLASWRTRLEEQGIALEGGVPIPGCERFEFRDPFGNRVELIERCPSNQNRGADARRSPGTA